MRFDYAIVGKILNDLFLYEIDWKCFWARFERKFGLALIKHLTHEIFRHDSFFLSKLREWRLKDAHRSILLDAFVVDVVVSSP